MVADDAISSVDDTLTARHATHGDFHAQAECAGILKELLRTQDRWRSLTFSQKESLDAICFKISRILNGNPNHPDHWHDIAGYARLVEKELTK